MQELLNVMFIVTHILWAAEDLTKRLDKTNP